MNTTISSRTDLDAYVATVLDGNADFDTAAIVDDLAEHVTYGRTTTADLEAVDFWAIAERHDTAASA